VGYAVGGMDARKECGDGPHALATADLLPLIRFLVEHVSMFAEIRTDEQWH
jgi:hypothetical protein